ncbi:MAG: YfcE family phosphodiesterase [Clostridia bacterium]|nr:YfcE family phosphodiesterase [Clostridia bacterium]
MKILVFSDSHGASYLMEMALWANEDADCVVFLGDGYMDWNIVNTHIFKETHAVRGNCDSVLSKLPWNDIFTVEDVGIYITHGWREHVKSGMETLVAEAKKNGCALVMFGHTHEQYEDYSDGVRLFNPGALARGDYGVAEIRGTDILLTHRSVL